MGMIWYDIWYRIVIWYEMRWDDIIWYRIILYHNIYHIIPPRYELSWVRDVLGTSCPGYESSWVRVVLDTSCPGYELSWVRVVLGTSCLGNELSGSPWHYTWAPRCLKPHKTRCLFTGLWGDTASDTKQLVTSNLRPIICITIFLLSCAFQILSWRIQFYQRWYIDTHVPDKTNWGLDRMSWYYAHILICFMTYSQLSIPQLNSSPVWVGHLAFQDRHSALWCCPL